MPRNLKASQGCFWLPFSLMEENGMSMNRVVTAAWRKGSSSLHKLPVVTNYLDQYCNIFSFPGNTFVFSIKRSITSHKFDYLLSVLRSNIQCLFLNQKVGWYTKLLLWFICSIVRQTTSRVVHKSMACADSAYNIGSSSLPYTYCIMLPILINAYTDGGTFRHFL